jgi:Gamma-glutamyl cyclotransferase, AIG2-like
VPLMFLNGTAMAGGADHHLVGGAPLVTATTTAPRYRFHAVGGRYPALEDVGEGGAAVAGEVYDLSYDQLREVLLPGEPDGLELGVIELADGTGSLAMILRREYPQLPDLTDISELASWRAYRDPEGSPAGPSTDTA